MKLVIVGGVAGGASAAARARRMDEDAEIIMFEKGDYISFANCGLPYHIGRVIPQRESLLVLTPEDFYARTSIRAKIKHEVIKINPEKKTVTVKNLEVGEEFEESYDKLILSPGSIPVIPPIEGADDPDIMTLWTINDMDKIISTIDAGAKSAAVIGAGFIGVEIAENLRHRKIQTHLIEMLPNVLPNLDVEMAQPLHENLRENGVNLHLSSQVIKISKAVTGNKKIFTITLQDGNTIQVDMVIMCVGVKPNVKLAKEANLEIGETGAIKVNEYLQTSNPDIYAVGDAIEVKNLILDTPARIPLAGPANRQGRIAANNVFGAKETYKGSLGTCVCKVFRFTAASTGVNEKTLRKSNKSYKKIYINPSSHASYYPGAAVMNIKVLFDDTGKILGAQIISEEGADKRIDVLATAIKMGLTVADLEELELAYAPPYGSGKDVINFIGFVANNLLKGDVDFVYPDAIPEGAFLLDVRAEDAFICGSVPNSINIPLSQLRERIKEIPADKEIVVICRVGLTAYIASRILQQKGYKVKVLSGGYLTWCLFNPDSPAGIIPTCNGPSCQTPEDVKKENAELTADMELNACGLQCPGPIVAVRNKIESMRDGQILKVTASDAGFMRDLPAWCNATGPELLEIQRGDDGIITAYVKKRKIIPVPSGATNVPPAQKRTTIVLFSNDLDKVMAGFIIATGFASMGYEVTMFFTFWGLNVLRKDNPPPVKKDILSKMFGMMMPRGAKKLALSKMHMMGMGTAMMKYVMNSKNVDDLPTLIKQAQAMGIKFIACEMAMNVMGIQLQELLDGVETAGVASFTAMADKSNTVLFI